MNYNILLIFDIKKTELSGGQSLILNDNFFEDGVARVYFSWKSHNLHARLDEQKLVQF